MALSADTLKSELASWMGNPATSKTTGISNFATAYENYAKNAISTVGGSYTSANKALLISTLNAGIPAVGTVANAITVFADAISKFWSGAILGASAVTSFSACNTALLASLVTPFNDISVTTTIAIKSAQLSTAIHAATLLVVTTNSGSSATGTLA